MICFIILKNIFMIILNEYKFIVCKVFASGLLLASSSGLLGKYLC